MATRAALDRAQTSESGGATRRSVKISLLHGGYSSAVEHRSVAPAVVGSNPTIRPKYFPRASEFRGPSARYARSGFRLQTSASLTPAKRLKFESHYPPQSFF